MCGRYSITDTGIELAEKLIRADGELQNRGETSGEELRFGFGAADAYQNMVGSPALEDCTTKPSDG